jgi:diguanylate cyclase (GGDEF)-like protein
MAHILTRAHELNDLLEMAADHACTALGAASASISQIVPDDDLIRTIINVGDLAPHEHRWPDDETYPITGDHRLMSTLQERSSWVDSVDDPDSGERDRALLQQLGKGSSLVTAIVVDGRSWGEFYATRHVGDPAFDEDAVAYAEVLVAILAAAVSRTIREAALQDLALRDPLTGLLNRRALDQRVDAVFDLGHDYSRSVAVVVVDIDGLKRVNDTEGHASGDRRICEVAEALTRVFGRLAASAVARVGGDEFTVLVAGSGVTAVESAINEVSSEVSERGVIGVSAGVAAAVITPVTGPSASELFAAADRAQYVAKRTRSGTAVVAADISIGITPDDVSV